MKNFSGFVLIFGLVLVAGSAVAQQKNADDEAVVSNEEDEQVSAFFFHVIDCGNYNCFVRRRSELRCRWRTVTIIGHRFCRKTRTISVNISMTSWI